MINNNIGINVSKQRNEVINLVDDGFQKDAYVNQLFNIFKNSEYFCIIYEEKHYCTICFTTIKNNIFNDILI